MRALRDRVRAEVEKIDTDAVRKRRETAKADRTLWVKDEHDNMATLCLYLPAAQAHTAYHAINARITAHPTDPNDQRRIGARRVDHALDLLSTALGIDLRTTADADADADTPTLNTDQITHLDRGAHTYTPSHSMQAAIRTRDRHCRFPGCRRPAIHCDLDHTLAFKAGGRTTYRNLGCLCRFHHRIKHTPGWHLTQDHDATFTWTSPTGQVFTTRPPPPTGEEAPDFCTEPAPDEDPKSFPF